MVSIDKVLQKMTELPEEIIIYTGDSFLSIVKEDLLVGKEISDQELALLIDLFRDMYKSFFGEDTTFYTQFRKEYGMWIPFEFIELIESLNLPQERVKNFNCVQKRRRKLDKLDLRLRKHYGMSEDMRELILEKARRYNR